MCLYVSLKKIIINTSYWPMSGKGRRHFYIINVISPPPHFLIRLSSWACLGRTIFAPRGKNLIEHQKAQRAIFFFPFSLSSFQGRCGNVYLKTPCNNFRDYLTDGSAWGRGRWPQETKPRRERSSPRQLSAGQGNRLGTGIIRSIIFFFLSFFIIRNSWCIYITWPARHRRP